MLCDHCDGSQFQAKRRQEELDRIKAEEERVKQEELARQQELQVGQFFRAANSRGWIRDTL